MLRANRRTSKLTVATDGLGHIEDLRNHRQRSELGVHT
jgi:hypothetical protein